MALDDAAKRIRGPKDSMVRLTVYRRGENGKEKEKEKEGKSGEQAAPGNGSDQKQQVAEPEVKEFSIKRGNVPLASVKEWRLLPSGIGYMLIGDFKESTARDMAKHIEALRTQGMKGLVIDLRWNPGGLLTSSKEVAELFLPKNTLVVYTQGRKTGKATLTDDMQLFTEKDPILPEGFPLAVLVNEQSASAAEIVTGALQFWARAVVVGDKSYGKGSVQTIIPLDRPEGAAFAVDDGAVLHARRK